MKLVRWLLLAIVLAETAAPLGATFPRRIAHYTHQSWTRQREAPAPVLAVAQARSGGYLWLATGEGLFRFDGIRFERIGGDLHAAHGAPSAVLVRRNGDVWTNFQRSRRFAVYRGGHLHLLPPSPVRHRVAVIAEAPDGAIWVQTEGEENAVLRFAGGRWTVFGPAEGVPVDNPFDLLIADDGAVWVSHGYSVLRLAPNATRFAQVRRREGSLGRLSRDPQGRIWLSDAAGSHPLSGPGGVGTPPSLRHAYPTDPGPIPAYPTFDRAGNLWMATPYRGIQRVIQPDPAGAPTVRAAAAAAENVRTDLGLSSNVTTRAFQDSEGNVWIATEKGLDKFWPASVRAEPGLTDPAAFGDLLLRAADGSVYVAEASALYRIAPGGSPTSILHYRIRPSTLCEAPDGAIWIGLGARVLVWRRGRITARLPDVPGDKTLYDCAFDARGDYWVSAARGGLYRLRAGRWEKMFGDTHPGFRPRSMIADGAGNLVVQWSDRLLRHLSPQMRDESIPFRLHDPEPVSLYAARVRSRPALYLGGPIGVVRSIDERRQRLSISQVPALRNVNGMLVTANGDHWFAAEGGIVHLAAREAERAFADPRYRPAAAVFADQDGLRSLPHDHSRSSMVQGGDGRIWIATQSGTVWIDPTDIVRNRQPPGVAIRAIRGEAVHRDPTTVRTKPGDANVEIDFAAFNFSNPDRTRVMYRMEGQDTHWINAGDRREAFYTNLSPGTYRFRVIAANEDGTANRTGAAVVIDVPPTFVQSRWFVLLCVLAAALLLWLALRLRAQQVAGLMRNRMEERLSERERIARDLHDTLLQGVQGLMFRFQAAADRMPARSAHRAVLEDALDRADEVIRKGRDSVRTLRSDDAEGDLRQIISGAIERALLDDSVEVIVREIGQPRRLHPVAAAEISAIVGEALFNVARHARASVITVTAEYGRRWLILRVEDDGVGLPGPLRSGADKDGHFGLVGMQERARSVGGTLAVASDGPRGTIVSLRVPSRAVFIRGPTCISRFVRRLSRRHD